MQVENSHIHKFHMSVLEVRCSVLFGSCGICPISIIFHIHTFQHQIKARKCQHPITIVTPPSSPAYHNAPHIKLSHGTQVLYQEMPADGKDQYQKMPLTCYTWQVMMLNYLQKLALDEIAFGHSPMPYSSLVDELAVAGASCHALMLCPHAI